MNARVSLIAFLSSTWVKDLACGFLSFERKTMKAHSESVVRVGTECTAVSPQTRGHAHLCTQRGIRRVLQVEIVAEHA
jgi:hypothetical protein